MTAFIKSVSSPFSRIFPTLPYQRKNSTISAISIICTCFHYWKVPFLLKRNNPFPPQNTLYFYVCAIQVLKTLGTEDIACNEQSPLLPHCFLPFWATFHLFHQTENCRLQTLLVWKFKFCHLVKRCRIYRLYMLWSFNLTN